MFYEHYMSLKEKVEENTPKLRVKTMPRAAG